MPVLESIAQGETKSAGWGVQLPLSPSPDCSVQPLEWSGIALLSPREGTWVLTLAGSFTYVRGSFLLEASF